MTSTPRSTRSGSTSRCMSRFWFPTSQSSFQQGRTSRQKALGLLVTGRSVGSRVAQQLGIFDRLFPADRLLPEALEFATSLAKGPTFAIGEIKIAARLGVDLPLEGGLALEREAIFRLFQGADATEGMAAFAEKRKPVWKGE